jgi:atypical dual specificity phosphatase
MRWTLHGALALLLATTLSGCPGGGAGGGAGATATPGPGQQHNPLATETQDPATDAQARDTARDQGPDPRQDGGPDLAPATPFNAKLRFGWVLRQDLAAMARPGLYVPLDQDLTFLQNQGVDLLVSLTETPLPADQLATYGLDLLHLPIRDFHAPTLEQMDAFVAAVDQRTQEGQSTGVHCTRGLGRTGTMLAVYLVSRGIQPQAAIDQVRALRPGSIENQTQELAVFQYARHLQQK